MKVKAVLKKLKLKKSDFDRIKVAVETAESKTAGEIALALVPESAHYSFWELLASMIFSAVLMCILLPFEHKIEILYQQLYWQNAPAWIMSLFYIIICFAAIVAGFYICNIPAVDRIIIPKLIKESSVTHRAFRYFTESAVYDTKDHCGVLIFVSYMERQVRIVADSGISAKISPDLWKLISDELTESIKKGQTAEGFINAVNRCGELLAEKFPAKEEKQNQLEDGLVILGDAEWY